MRFCIRGKFQVAAAELSQCETEKAVYKLLKKHLRVHASFLQYLLYRDLQASLAESFASFILHAIP